MKLKQIYSEGLLDKLMTGIVKIVMAPSTNKMWKDIENDPELKKHKDDLQKLQKDLVGMKTKLKNNKVAMDYLKSIGADTDFLTK